MTSTGAVVHPNQTGNAPAQDDDRRYSARVKLIENVKVRRLNSSHDAEWGTLVDLSRDGLYFTSRSRHYQVGMELGLSFGSTGLECVCQVVRVENLPGGRLGIGAGILSW
jgi:PilZ domain